MQQLDVGARLQLVLSVDHDLLVSVEAGVDESLSVADLRDGNRPDRDGVVGIDDVRVGSFRTLLAFRKLPIAPPGGIPYEWLIPGIGRQLALMKPVERKVASPDATKRKLVALKKHAKIHCEDMSAMALLPLKLRILIVEIAQENPKLPPPAGRGAPQKSLAMQVARTVAEHFYGLTGTRPTRITPPGGGKAHGPFLEFLATTYRILGIKASAENQAKAAINFVMKKYPKT